jgi:outer membrane lipoprotein SlyB
MKHAKHIKRGFKRFGKIMYNSPFTLEDYQRANLRAIPGAAIGGIAGCMPFLREVLCMGNDQKPCIP